MSPRRQVARPAGRTTLSGWLAGAGRWLVGVILRAHPRDFRRRYGDDVLEAVDDDLREAASANPATAGRAAASAVLDALTGVTARPGSEPTSKERTSMRNFWQNTLNDVALGLRSFRREPGWCAAIVLTLALGIGLNAAMFGIADRLLLSGPEQIFDAGRVRRMQIARERPGTDAEVGGIFPYAAYLALGRSKGTFAAVAAYNEYPDNSVLGRGTEAQRITAGEATASLFPLLGVRPAAGRFFTTTEDDPVAPHPVVVIGYELWQREFEGRPDAVGRALELDNVTYTVIGVTPRGFTGPDLGRVDVWYPESIRGGARLKTNWTQSWNSLWLALVARLAPGVSDDQASRQATALFRNAAPATNNAYGHATATLAVRPLSDGRDGKPSMETRISTWLVGVAAMVLLISCANVINLILARAVRRRREIAVRQALGAGRGRLIRLLVAEAVTLAAFGGAAGLFVAYVVGTLMRAWLLPAVEWPSGPVNLRVLAVSALISITAGFVVGLLPAWRASQPDVVSSLKAGVREGGGRREGTRAVLTILQAALCALLLVGSGLFVVSLRHVRTTNLGLEPDRVILVSVRRAGIPSTDTDLERQNEADRRRAFYPKALDALERRPDVEAAALAVGLPFWSAFGEDIKVPGLDEVPKLKGGGPYLSAVSADYFKTVGTPILRGRAFTPADRAGSAPVAVVNETMARTLWPGKEALGQCFEVVPATVCTTVVGVASDTRHFALEEPESMSYYVPLGQEVGIGGTSLLVRPRGPMPVALAALRQAILTIDPTVTYVQSQELQDLVEPQMRPWELGATMFSLMGLLALAVAAVGLYSVMSYFVADRTHEIGVRMALGARPGDIARLVVRGGLLLVIAGVVAGFSLALLAGGRVEPLLFQTSPHDVAVFVEVGAALIGMAIAASIIPAARARRVNPVAAMRTE